MIQTTLLNYRLQLPGFELSEAVRVAQREFDDQSAKILDRAADRFEGKATQEKDSFENSFERLERTVHNYSSEAGNRASRRTPNLSCLVP